MIWRPFTRQPGAQPTPAPEPVNHGRALAKIGHDQRRAKVRATTRAICAAAGIPIPPVLEN